MMPKESHSLFSRLPQLQSNDSSEWSLELTGGEGEGCI